MELQSLLRFTYFISSVAVLAACSSAETSTPTTTPTTPTAVTISGSIFASSVNQASVTVKDTSGNTVAGPVLTASDGSYSIDMLNTDLAGDLVFESSGGEFTDEETGTTNVAAGAMSAYVTGGTLANGDSVHVTPGTTICSELVSAHGKSSSQALNDFFSAFAYNPDISVEPVDINDPAAMTAEDASRHAGWTAAVFSKLANTLTLQPQEQFAMFEAMAQDLSDGKLDGVDASGAVSIGATGKTLPANIKDQYITAAGSFTTAEAANLKVIYTPLTMNNVHGKNQFTLEITDTAGTPVTGLTSADLKVMPLMYMADRTHSTPMGEIVETVPNVSGIYNVTVYYLMPSRMMDGTTMGTWDLKVMANMKTVHFYPNINMAMMDNTARVQLKGVNDTIIDMNGLEVPRTYNLFRDGNPVSVGANTYDFGIFIAPMENMMSFPALINGMTLTSGMDGTPYLVNGIDIDVSVNGGSWMTNKDMDNGDGTWTLNAISLNSGANEIKVRLTVSSEIKTTNGLDAVADTNDFATFTVTLP